MIDPITVNQYSQKILQIIENIDDFTQSDLQGAVDAIVIDILNSK